jgi:glycosyltransferase involved in cell wall biosynthesis
VLLAAERLRDRSDIRFLFIGGGELRGELETEAAARGLSSILLKPYQPAEILAQSLAVADAHWVSLRAELEGLVVPSKFYANAAAGRPIIAVMEEEGELAGTVRSSGCGFVVPLGDGAALARAIQSLADDPALARKFGRAARAMIEAQFSRSHAMSRWSDLFDEFRARPLLLA